VEDLQGRQSGIFFRASEDKKLIWHSSMEIQILDHDNFKTGGKNPEPLKESQKAGTVQELYDAVPASYKNHGEWNTVTIRGVGMSIRGEQNGHLIADFKTDSEDFKTRFAASKFAKAAPNS